MAQMTVAAAIGHEEADHWTHHLVDTIKSGQGLCNEELSYLLCRQAGDRILEMKNGKLIGLTKMEELFRLWHLVIRLNGVVTLIF